MKIKLMLSVLAFALLIVGCNVVEDLDAPLEIKEEEQTTDNSEDIQESDDNPLEEITGNIIMDTNKEEAESEEEEEATEDIEEPAPTNQHHLIEVTKDGFKPDKLTIKVGDTVEWKNVRSGSLNKAMIVGTQKCVNVRSKLFETGKSFEHTFDETTTCTIVDGYTTTQTGKVIVE